MRIYDAAAKGAALAGKKASDTLVTIKASVAQLTVAYDGVVKYIRGGLRVSDLAQDAASQTWKTARSLSVSMPILEKPDRKYMKNVPLPAIL